MATPVRLHFVTGKGGVGKSTVAAALARAALRSGKRVLAVELPTPGGLSRIFGIRPALAGFPVQIEPRLWLSYVDGGAALSEYLGRVLRSRRLREAVLGHRLFRAFAVVAPGVSELMAMGKIRDELRQRDGFRHRYDVVVVDAGATGHALSYLRMHNVAQRTFGSRGRVRREADKIDRLLRDPKQTAIHIVTLPEHMPLREAEGLLASLREEPALPVRALVVNRCLEVAPPGTDDELGLLSEALAPSMRWNRHWEDLQEEGIARFAQATGMSVTRLPQLLGTETGELGEDERETLATTVGSACL